MLRGPATTTALDFYSPHSRPFSDSHHTSTATYSQPDRPRPQSLLASDINAHAERAAPPEPSFHGDSRRSAADGQRPVSNPPPHSAQGRLPTPPADEMSVYQPIQNSTNSSREGSTFPSIAQFHQLPATTQAQPYHYPVRAAEAAPKFSNGTGQVFHQLEDRSRDVRGTHEVVERPQEAIVQKKDAIHPNMQIPPSVNDSGGSIGELAAQLTCLFWFETTDTLRKAEDWTSTSSPPKRLAPDALPTGGFRKWVVTILSTTQVTPNVILLALLFIYRLKTLNPTVKGKAGSEYRLLTVALMLGNKFLDDNTYTNKTWAEVSGISVGEIHVMEVEFLSNMRYSLLASYEQWAEWQIKLGKFAAFFERASKLPMSPVGNGYPTSAFLPSPTSLSAQSPGLNTNTCGSAYMNTPYYDMSQPYHPQYTPAQSLPQPVQTSKKRAFEDVWAEPPAKRPATTITASQVPTPLSQLPTQLPTPLAPIPRQNMPRLPAPNLSIPATSSLAYPSFPQTLPPLPPINGRAMAHVYPVTPGWTPQAQMTLPPAGPPAYSLPSSNHGTPSRRHSPRSIGVHSMNSSPISGIFPNASHDLNSPSIFLQQRNSPYKPVRLPNTLLYPPPSSSFHHFQLGAEQMHYQPLGKRNDYRSGIVPEYAGGPGIGNWQRWPPIQQPSFHTSN